MKYRRIVNIAIYVFAIFLLAWTFFPIYTMIKIAISTTRGVYIVSLFPIEISLSGFWDVITGNFYAVKNFWLYTGNSIFVAVGTVAIVVPISLLGGYALAKIPFKLKKEFGIITMLTYLFPQAFIALAIYRVMITYGLANSLVGVILVTTAFNSPFSIFIALDYANSIPKEIEEAAKMDGASRLQMFTKLFVPLSVPAVITISIYVFLRSWENYLIPLLLLGDEKIYTLPLMLGYFFSTDEIAWNVFMATGIMYAIPPLIFYLVFKQFMLGGIMRGALKF